MLRFSLGFAVAVLSATALLAPPAAHAAPLAKGANIHIMAMDDSIIEGKFVKFGGYRLPLRNLLEASGYKVTYVGKEDNGDPANETGFAPGMTNANHEGYGNMRIDQLTKDGEAEGHTVPPIAVTLQNDKPDVILLMLGANDLLQNHDLGGILGRLDTLVGDIFTDRKGVKLILASATPMSGERDKLATVYASGVSFIVEKYKALGDDITYADMFSALDPTTDLPGGVHPNEIGYEKMANVWFQALTGITPTPIVEPASAAESARGTASIVGKQGAISFSSGTRDEVGGPFSLGFRFTTGPADVTVIALGYLNDEASGANAVHSVGIYTDATHALVTPAITVTTTGGDLTETNATFTYVKLPTPVPLSASTTYEIAATMAHTGFIKRETGVTLANGIVPASAIAVYEASAPLASPSHTYSPNGSANIGPNFLTSDEATLLDAQ